MSFILLLSLGYFLEKFKLYADTNITLSHREIKNKKKEIIILYETSVNVH